MNSNTNGQAQTSGVGAEISSQAHTPGGAECSKELA
jgi:hypothetical protein